MKLYANFDRVAGVYDAPIPMPNDSYAKRAVSEAIVHHKVSASQLSDFALYCLGDYNQETGEIVGEVRFVINLIDLCQSDDTKENIDEN